MSVDAIYKDIETRMKKAVENFKTEISRLRTGRATPAILDGVRVEYYGTQVPLNQVANIAIPDASLIVIQPWDKTIIGEIERAIKKSGLGLNPQNDGNVIRLPIPPLSDERRKELVKIVKKFAEDARIAVRNIRRDGMEKVKRMGKDKEISEDERKRAEEKTQEITDKYVNEINKILASKEKEILEE